MNRTQLWNIGQVRLQLENLIGDESDALKIPKKPDNNWKYRQILFNAKMAIKFVEDAIEREPERLIPFWNQSLFEAVRSGDIVPSIYYEYTYCPQNDGGYSLLLFYDDGNGGQDSIEFAGYIDRQQMFEDVEQLKKEHFTIYTEFEYST